MKRVKGFFKGQLDRTAPPFENKFLYLGVDDKDFVRIVSFTVKAK